MDRKWEPTSQWLQINEARGVPLFEVEVLPTRRANFTERKPEGPSSAVKHSPAGQEAEMCPSKLETEAAF